MHFYSVAVEFPGRLQHAQASARDAGRDPPLGARRQHVLRPKGRTRPRGCARQLLMYGPDFTQEAIEVLEAPFKKLKRTRGRPHLPQGGACLAPRPGAAPRPATVEPAAAVSKASPARLACRCLPRADGAGNAGQAPARHKSSVLEAPFKSLKRTHGRADGAGNAGRAPALAGPMWPLLSLVAPARHGARRGQDPGPWGGGPVAAARGRRPRRASGDPADCYQTPIAFFVKIIYCVY